MPVSQSSKRPPPLDIQIAFQGGGARLALLLPVVEALQELETGDPNKGLQPEIVVTRVSGTSAGAIAAALLAGDGNIPALLEYLRRLSANDQTLRSIFPPTSKLGVLGKLQLAKRLLWDKKPIGDEGALSKLLGDALEAANIRRGSSVGELAENGKPCLLVSVNLGSKDRVIAPPNAKLVQALADSAALPFIFRLSGDRMDGGILDNLPIDALKSPATPGSASGHIVAVAFDEPDFVPQPGNAFELAAALLDTTMTFKTRASRDAVTPDHVYELPGDVGGLRVTSFDIQTFMDFINDKNAYQRVKDRTATWFRNFIKLKEQQRTRSGPPPEKIEVNRKLEAVEANLRVLAEQNFHHPTMKVDESVFEIIAHSLEDPDNPDRSPDIVRSIDKVRVGNEPLFVHAGVLFSAKPIISRDYKVFDSRQQQVEFVAFDIPGETKGVTWHLTVFTRPLPPSSVKDETYTIQHTYRVLDFMRPLLDEGGDYLGQEFAQAEVTKVAEIRLCVPKHVGPLVLLPGSPEELATLKIPLDELTARKAPLVAGRQQKKQVVPACPEGYDAYVWRGEGCERGHALRVVYRKAGFLPD